MRMRLLPRVGLTEGIRRTMGDSVPQWRVDMSALHVATSVKAVMSEQGGQFKARRTAIGLSVSALAKRAGVDRGSLTNLEDGKPVRDTTVALIDKTLSDLEHELGMDEPSVVEAPAAAAAPAMIRFTVEGVYGAKALVVEGPVENIAELEAAVDKIMRRLAGEQGDTPPQG